MRFLTLLTLACGLLFSEETTIEYYMNNEGAKERVIDIAFPFLVALKQHPDDGFNRIMANTSRAKKNSEKFHFNVRESLNGLAQVGKDSKIEMEFYAVTDVGSDYKIFHYLIKTQDLAIQANIEHYVFDDKVYYGNMGYTSNVEQMLENTKYATKFNKSLSITLDRKDND